MLASQDTMVPSWIVITESMNKPISKIVSGMDYAVSPEEHPRSLMVAGVRELPNNRASLGNWPFAFLFSSDN